MYMKIQFLFLVFFFIFFCPTDIKYQKEGIKRAGGIYLMEKKLEN